MNAVSHACFELFSLLGFRTISFWLRIFLKDCIAFFLLPHHLATDLHQIKVLYHSFLDSEITSLIPLNSI